MSDIVADLDGWLEDWPPQDCVPVIERARDEIVALRKEVEWRHRDDLKVRAEALEQAAERSFLAGMIAGRLERARAEALEEAAQTIERMRVIHEHGFSKAAEIATLMDCITAIRALKERP